MINVSDGNKIYYYHFDGLGSVVALSDVNNVIVESYSYDVFGEPDTTSSIGNPYMFTGRRYDSETSNYYYRARIYKPSIGRFLQPDPIGYDDGMNIYAYVGNNPIAYIDSMGFCKENSFGKKLWDGDYLGTQYGQEATDLWVAKAVASKTWYGKAGNYLGASFAALWTPETWKETAVVLGTAGYGAINSRIAARSAGLSDEIASTFRGGAYRTRVLQNNVTAHRYSGGTSFPKGRFLTTRQTVNQIVSPSNAQKMLNLPTGATAETLNTFTIPKGTTIYTGRVAGGGAKATQIFIENSGILY